MDSVRLLKWNVSLCTFVPDDINYMIIVDFVVPSSALFQIWFVFPLNASCSNVCDNYYDLCFIIVKSFYCRSEMIQIQ